MRKVPILKQVFRMDFRTSDGDIVRVSYHADQPPQEGLWLALEYNKEVCAGQPDYFTDVHTERQPWLLSFQIGRFSGNTMTVYNPDGKWASVWYRMMEAAK